MTDTSWHTLVSATDLLEREGNSETAVFDCRFTLANPDEGELQFLSGHIPGAYYAHLDLDLSGPIVPGKTGRHPLPDPQDFVDFLAQRGVSSATQVVCYDDKGGAIAGRLWWLCKWIGHERAAVLDGGLQAWIEAGGELQTTIPALPERGRLQLNLRKDLVADATAVADRDPGISLLDARGTARYTGEHEPIDPVAGHIPGAQSYPYEDNLAGGQLLGREKLRQRYGAVPGIERGEVVCYCGSGVTAAHDALAIVHAGFPMPMVYPGSWSEWITDRTREIETGI